MPRPLLALVLVAIFAGCTSEDPDARFEAPGGPLSDRLANGDLAAGIIFVTRWQNDLGADLTARIETWAGDELQGWDEIDLRKDEQYEEDDPWGWRSAKCDRRMTHFDVTYRVGDGEPQRAKFHRSEGYPACDIHKPSTTRLWVTIAEGSVRVGF